MRTSSRRFLSQCRWWTQWRCHRENSTARTRALVRAVPTTPAGAWCGTTRSARCTGKGTSLWSIIHTSAYLWYDVYCSCYYRRDATNPTFRKIRLQDVLGVHGARKLSEDGERTLLRRHDQGHALNTLPLTQLLLLQLQLLGHCCYYYYSHFAHVTVQQ